MSNKKIIFCFPLFLIFLFSSYSEKSSATTLSITQEAGILNGNIYEYVTETACKNTNNIESLLDWELKNIPYWKNSYLLTTETDYFYNFDFLIGFPCSSGHMQDYDWLNFYYSPKDDPTELTNYSIHNNYNNLFCSFSLNGGKKIVNNSDYSISLFMGCDFTFVSFSGTDGYKTYKSDNWEKIPFYGNVISYTQSILTPYAGLTTSLNFNSRISADFSLAFNPGMGYVNAKDYHFINRSDRKNNIIGGTLYNDRIENTVSIKLKCKTSISLNEKNKIGISAELFASPTTIGDNYYEYMDLNGNITSTRWLSGGTDVGGTSSFYATAGITCTHLF